MLLTIWLNPKKNSGKQVITSNSTRSQPAVKSSNTIRTTRVMIRLSNMIRTTKTSNTISRTTTTRDITIEPVRDCEMKGVEPHEIKIRHSLKEKEKFQLQLY